MLRWPLDHLFVTPHFKLQHSTFAFDRLDHCPILYAWADQPAAETLVPVK